jgi:predicted small lipoprotein YifL
MSNRHIPQGTRDTRGSSLFALTLALTLVLSGAIALGGALSGCGQKGPLYLPQQKKSRVPATPSNPAPEPTATPPSDTSSPNSDSTPPA